MTIHQTITWICHRCGETSTIEKDIAPEAPLYTPILPEGWTMLLGHAYCPKHDYTSSSLTTPVTPRSHTGNPNRLSVPLLHSAQAFLIRLIPPIRCLFVSPLSLVIELLEFTHL